MAFLSDSVRSDRLLLLGLLPLLLALEGDGTRAAVGGDAGSGPGRRALPGGASSELALDRDGSIAVSATETLQPMRHGGARRVLSLSPVRWRDDLGDWQRIEASFAAAASGFMTESDSLSCHFPSRCDATFSAIASGGGPRLTWTGGAMEIRRENGTRLVVTPAPAPVPARHQSDGSLLYFNAWPGVSERYRLEPGLMKHEVVLEQLPAAGPGDELVLSWLVEIDASATSRIRIPTLQTAFDFESDGAGGFRVVGADGHARLWLPAPYLVEDVEAEMLDAQSGLPGLPSEHDPAQEDARQPLALSWRSTPEGDGLRLELALPFSELLARADSFPLVIDPTVVDLLSPAGVLTVFAADRFDLLGERRGLATGDFNGDGQLDLVVAAHRGDGVTGLRPDAGELHLLFGPLGDGTRDLASDKGDVTIGGADRFDTLGWSVAAGDLNGDGVDDLLLGAPFADGPANLRSGAGEAHVLLGPFASGEVRDLSVRPGELVLHGAHRSHGLGYAVAIGDVTGDGFGDAIVSALRSDGPLGDREGAGSVHVLAGPVLRSPLPRVVDLAVEAADAVVHGQSAGDQLGAALVAGDLDADGTADLALSSLSSQGRDDARPQAGEVLVLLGPLAAGSVLDLAAQGPDASVFGASAGDLFGHDLAIGDLSGDGVGDLVAGAHLSDGPNGARDRAGSVTALFGPFTTGLVVDVAAGDADLLVHGAGAADLAGWSVATGDLSGDGQEDLLLGAVAADGPANGRSSSGELHALLGPFAPGSVIDLADGSSEIEVQGAQRSDQLGYSVRVADLTGDGVGDLIGGAKTARGPGESRPAGGEAVVVQGRGVGCRSDADCSDDIDCTVDTCDVMTGECSFDDLPCNTPPTCALGPDRSSGCRALVMEDLVVEDVDGDALSFSWSSSDPDIMVFPASGDVAAGEGSRLLPDTLATLVGGEAACQRTAVLTLLVSDGRGGEASCQVTVSFSDEEPPALLGVPGNAVVDCDAVPAPAAVVAMDGCDESPLLSSNELRIDGACPHEYRLERSWLAVDACGNASEALQIIEVVDEVGPVVHATNDRLHCLWPPDHRMVAFTANDFAPLVEDSCGGEISWRFIDCASNQPDDETGDGSTEEDCVVDADGQGFSVRAERAGNRLEQRRYKVVIVATDVCGNDSAPTAIGYVGVSHDRGLLVGSGDCSSTKRR